MKKNKIIYILLLISVLFIFTGCSNDEVVEEVVVDEVELEVLEPEIEEIKHETTEEGKIYEEKIKDLNSFVYYRSSINNYSIIGSTEYTEDEITENFVLNTILSQFSEKEVLINSFTIEETEHKIEYIDNEPVLKELGYSKGYLDLNMEFQNIINEEITPLMQWMIIQSVSNGFIKNFGCKEIYITVDGLPLSTMYKQYELDEAISFSTKVYDNFDILNEEEMEASRTIEQLINDGFVLTSDDYQNTLTELDGNIENEEVVGEDLEEIETEDENIEILETDSEESEGGNE